MEVLFDEKKKWIQTLIANANKRLYNNINKNNPFSWVESHLVIHLKKVVCYYFGYFV